MIRHSLLVCLGLLLLNTQAFAQNDSHLTQKALRSGYAGNTGSMNLRHARDHAVILNQLGTSGSVPKEIVKEQTQAIRAKSEAAVKEYTKLKELNPDNKDVAKSVDVLKHHHENVLAMCTMLDEASATTDAKGTTVCDCCKTIVKELDAAAKEADKIRDTLKIAPLKDPGHEHHENAKK